MILVVDNTDSFTYNLVQALGSLGAGPEAVRTRDATPAWVERRAPDRVVISPGPGPPARAGHAVEIIRRLSGKLPILGVCLGHQCIAEALGGRTGRAPRPMHGKTSTIHHDGRGVFEGLPRTFQAMRYHSLVVEEPSLPPELEVTARSPEGEIMGLRHRDQPLEGVQFHPESYRTEAGIELLRNFLNL